MPISPSILIVEDGTIVADANTLVDWDYAENYHLLRGNDAWTDGIPMKKQQALIRASHAFGVIYRDKLLGQQVSYGVQTLEYPRTGVVINEIEQAEDSIPDAIQQAVCELALRELATPNSIMPDLERGGDIKSVKADTVSIEFMDRASSFTSIPFVDKLLVNYISGTFSSGFSVSDIIVTY
jgi:hypothetical protein